MISETIAKELKNIKWTMHVLLVKRLFKNLIFYFNLSVSKTEQLVETGSNIENNKVVSLKEVTLKHKGKKNNASIFTSAPK